MVEYQERGGGDTGEGWWRQQVKEWWRYRLGVVEIPGEGWWRYR